MMTGRNDEFASIIIGAGRQGKAAVQHAVDMILIAFVIAADPVLPG